MVLDALNAKRAKNQPMIVRCQHQVIANHSWGVSARQDKMWVVWCYLERCGEWEANLGSANIQQQIKDGNSAEPKGPYKHFPNYKTIDQNGDLDLGLDLVQLTKEQVTLLADFACDCILLDDEQTIKRSILGFKFSLKSRIISWLKKIADILLRLQPR